MNYLLIRKLKESLIHEKLNIENVGDLPDENQKTYNNKIETQFFLDTQKKIILKNKIHQM